jgi:hypothetical protein
MVENVENTENARDALFEGVLVAGFPIDVIYRNVA